VTLNVVEMGVAYCINPMKIQAIVEFHQGQGSPAYTINLHNVNQCVAMLAYSTSLLCNKAIPIQI